MSVTPARSRVDHRALDDLDAPTARLMHICQKPSAGPRPRGPSPSLAIALAGVPLGNEIAMNPSWTRPQATDLANLRIHPRSAVGNVLRTPRNAPPTGAAGPELTGADSTTSTSRFPRARSSDCSAPTGRARRSFRQRTDRPSYRALASRERRSTLQRDRSRSTRADRRPVRRSGLRRSASATSRMPSRAPARPTGSVACPRPRPTIRY